MYIQDDEDACGANAEDADPPSEAAVHEAIRNDELRRLERAERSNAESAILLAAKIIAPRISTSYEDGYEWCIEQVCTIHTSLFAIIWQQTEQSILTRKKTTTDRELN